jgi:transcriptional regulator with XRE-family HTH domain
MKQKKTVTIGTELKEILDRKEITSYRLAKEMGMGQSYLSRLFKNRFNPSYELVKDIAERLGYDLRLVKKQSKKKGGETLKSRIREKGR